jgi:general secretion pathway protein A
MYNSFFKLARKPFEMSPDPYFLYPTVRHHEALAGLYYGIKSRKGFMVLTGEVGTGKTLVLRCLLDLLARQRVAFAYVFNTLLNSRQFLQYLADDLGIGYRSASKSDLLIQLSRALIERHRQSLTTLVVVDEAQHLTLEVLEEIRLLTNLEMPQGKLLQIVLAGQPELDQKLELHELRQLKQRVALRFRLEALSELETRGYVQRRLKLAGNDSHVFPLPTLQRIYHYSQGTPRVINTLCDNAMISAFSLGAEQVSPELIDEAAADLRLHGPHDSAGGQAAGPINSDAARETQQTGSGKNGNTEHPAREAHTQNEEHLASAVSPRSYIPEEN